MYIIYKHTNKINGKSYIGLTQQNPRKRFKHGTGYPKRDQPLFHKAIEKYGWENFETEIIEANIKTRELANEREIYWIAFYHTWIYDPKCNGYNALPGGNSNPGHSQTDETKLKISQKLKGIKRSAETRQKMSEAKAGRKLSEETKQKLKAANIGKRTKPVICIETGEKFKSVKAVTEKYGDLVRKCLKGKYKKAYGYHWKYDN